MILVGIGGLYLLAHLGHAIDTTPRMATGSVDLKAVISAFNGNIEKPFLFYKSLLHSSSYTFKFVALGLMAGVMWLLLRLTTRKKFRKGEEHGSARWATEREGKRLIDKRAPDQSIILTDDVMLGLNTRQSRKNLNVLVIGGSGSGKTRFYVKPNLMQMNTSYIVTDPKGELLRSTGKMLEKNGYVVKVFNLINMRNSLNYNPFAYLTDTNGNYSDANVIKLINVLMKNTKKEGQGSGDQFWEDSTEALLLALAFYLVYEGNENEKNFATMMDLVQLAEAKEDEEDFKSPLDIMFEDLEAEDKLHPAVKYYKIFKKAAGKTAKSILISTAVRLKAFNNQDVMNLTFKDTINIAEIGEQKTALFVVIPDSDDTFNFLVAMLYTQIFDVLYGLADFKHRGRLPVHVRFLLDEFANIGQIPRFDKLIATMRSREISVNPILQNLAQLKTMYKDSWETIVGNCDSRLFLGGSEQSTLEYISKAVGKETIDTVNRNVSRSSRSNSSSLNEGKVGRELMTPNEVGEMPDSDCVLLVRGLHPFYSKKFRLERHKNYKELDDFDSNNGYDISNLKTEVMPKSGLLNMDDEDLDLEENDELIREILGEREDEEIMETIEIPDGESDESEDVEVLMDSTDNFQDEQVSMSENDFVIEGLTIEKGDELSELNYEELIIDETDEVIPDEEN